MYVSAGHQFYLRRNWYCGKSAVSYQYAVLVQANPAIVRCLTHMFNDKTASTVIIIIIIIIIIIYPLTVRVVGAPQMISQPVFSIFPCSPLPSWDLTNSRPVLSLMLSSYLFLCLLCLLSRFTVP